MKTKKIDTSEKIDNEIQSERVHQFFGNITVSGGDGKVWYIVSAKNTEPQDYERMQEDKPIKTPMTITDENLQEWRMSPRMDSTMIDWRKKKGGR
jgi:hypothetical protein